MGSCGSPTTGTTAWWPRSRSIETTGTTAWWPRSRSIEPRLREPPRDGRGADRLSPDANKDARPTGGRAAGKPRKVLSLHSALSSIQFPFITAHLLPPTTTLPSPLFSSSSPGHCLARHLFSRKLALVMGGTCCNQGANVRAADQSRSTYIVALTTCSSAFGQSAARASCSVSTCRAARRLGALLTGAPGRAGRLSVVLRPGLRSTCVPGECRMLPPR